jgi:hypothetical protein
MPRARLALAAARRTSTKHLARVHSLAYTLLTDVVM